MESITTAQLNVAILIAGFQADRILESLSITERTYTDDIGCSWSFRTDDASRLLISTTNSDISTFMVALAMAVEGTGSSGYDVLGFLSRFGNPMVERFAWASKVANTLSWPHFYLVG